MSHLGTERGWGNERELLVPLFCPLYPGNGPPFFENILSVQNG